MKFCFLTDEFFDLYKECEEIEKKNNRPYATVCILKYNNLYFAIPIRHNIKHQYAIFTDKEKTKGLDLSKTLIIKDLKFVVQDRTAFILQDEYSQLIEKESFIISKLNSYSELLPLAEVGASWEVCAFVSHIYLPSSLGSPYPDKFIL